MCIDTLTKHVISSPRWAKSWEALIHRRRACALISSPPEESNGREESRRLIKHPESLRLGRNAAIRLMQAGTRNKRCRENQPLTGRPDSKSESDQGTVCAHQCRTRSLSARSARPPRQGRHRPRSSLLAASSSICEKAKNGSAWVVKGEAKTLGGLQVFVETLDKFYGFYASFLTMKRNMNALYKLPELLTGSS
jgi:hypothetical protein